MDVDIPSIQTLRMDRDVGNHRAKGLPGKPTACRSHDFAVVREVDSGALPAVVARNKDNVPAPDFSEGDIRARSDGDVSGEVQRIIGVDGLVDLVNDIPVMVADTLELGTMLGDIRLVEMKVSDKINVISHVIPLRVFRPASMTKRHRHKSRGR